MKILVKTNKIEWCENEHHNSIITYSSIITDLILEELLKQKLDFCFKTDVEEWEVPFDEA